MPPIEQKKHRGVVRFAPTPQCFSFALLRKLFPHDSSSSSSASTLASRAPALISNLSLSREIWYSLQSEVTPFPPRSLRRPCRAVSGDLPWTRPLNPNLGNCSSPVYILIRINRLGWVIIIAGAHTRARIRGNGRYTCGVRNLRASNFFFWKILLFFFFSKVTNFLKKSY